MVGTNGVRRIVVCVDGTWYNEDGREGNGYGNNSNVFRIYASIKREKMTDKQGNNITQIVRYFQGIGVDKTPLDTWNGGITGVGCGEQIREVYDFCCKEMRSEDDEVWLFGFSRGAYVVRAVAALLHKYTLKAVNGVPDGKDKSTWDNLKRLAGLKRDERRTMGGQEYRFTLEHTRPPPKIKFIGLFDTVKMVIAQDKFYETVGIDVSFAEHVRHAVALNEERRMFPLLPLITNERAMAGRDQDSHLQAWFVGAHADMGGGAEHDGLSLYPLQWILIESQGKGLILEHNPESRLKGFIENPLKLAFPNPPQRLSVQGVEAYVPDVDSINDEPWKFRYSNGIEISMYDLRQSHRHGNLQRIPTRKLRKQRQEEKGRGKNKEKQISQYSSDRSWEQLAGKKVSPPHWVSINSGLLSGLRLGKRDIFGADNFGTLQGYSTLSRNGTVVHPSVYFLLDTYPTLGIQQALKGLRDHLDDYREKASLTHFRNNAKAPLDPWIREVLPHFTSCRILICGNAGVGKSTLLNRVFGIELTNVNHAERGKHDIEVGFESDQHPGIIIHDSEGFQTGNTKEVDALKRFLKARANNVKVEDNLHAIWLCIDTDTERPVQSALAKVLELATKYMPSTPIVVVGTKKDKHLLLCQNPPGGVSQTEEAIILRRKKLFEERFENEPDTSIFWPPLDVKFCFVSRDDQVSIKNLIHLTMLSLEHTAISEAMCAAQVSDIEAKVAQAVKKTLRLLRSVVVAASAGFGTGVVSAVTTPTISRVLCREIAQGCFGLPDRVIKDMDEILAAVVWRNLAPFMAQAVGQSIFVCGGAVCLTLFTAVGGIPLAAGAMLFEAPAAARMFLKCACDLTLVLESAYRSGGKTMSSKRVEQAANTYAKSNFTVIRNGVSVTKSRRGAVHQAVNDIVPMFSALAIKAFLSESTEKLERGIQDVLVRHRLDEVLSTVPGSDNDGARRDVIDIPEDEDDLREFKRGL
ncbi:hypothetical protein CFIO01_06798 [Colletotrichum fioriniae PJ7]|uniref:DUF2235 domain-containing protein n=1 Tax=Colletotrichum fioriniae PJ7 TaxID=1445577 RepID=A0A010R919_9PEZI|nr:hypothetical protein CFIO01_06798 [Colletotrichum fioriniae PJ7]